MPEDDPVIDSVIPVWGTADFHERETFDFFGIVFKNHPNLTRILMPEDWEGYPLRKDFPLTYEQPQFSWNKDDPPEVIK